MTTEQIAQAADPAAPEDQSNESQATQEAVAQQDGEQGGSQEAQEQQQGKQRDELSPRAMNYIKRAAAEKGKWKAKAEEEAAENARLREALNGRQHQADEAEDDPAPRQPSQPKADPVEIARLMRDVDRTSERSNTVFAKGEKAFKDFRSQVDTVVTAAPLIDSRSGLPTAFGDAVLESDDPHLVINYLAQNPDEAAEIAELRPVQAARRIARIETELRERTKKSVSSAPKPLDAVKPAARGDGQPDPKDTEAWIKWRRAQRNKA